MITKGLGTVGTKIKHPLFPASFNTKPYRYQALLGIGGNIGDVVRRFEKLAIFLQKDPFVALHTSGSLLKNPAFGFTNQADFYNSVLLVSTNLRPKALLRYLLQVEKRFGRKRSFQDAPRTLDIDIIFYANEKIEDKTLTIPHPQWQVRSSVVIPLSDLGVAV